MLTSNYKFTSRMNFSTWYILDHGIASLDIPDTYYVICLREISLRGIFITIIIFPNVMEIRVSQ